jgi:hypothetical protein
MRGQGIKPLQIDVIHEFHPVARGVLVGVQQLVGVVERCHRSVSYLVDHRRLQVEVQRTRHILHKKKSEKRKSWGEAEQVLDKRSCWRYLARAGLVEEGVEAGLALRSPWEQGAVTVDAVFETVQLPTTVADLHAGLATSAHNRKSCRVEWPLRTKRSG